MIQANISDAKTHLSKYIQESLKGTLVFFCNRNTPVVELKALPKKKERKIGLYDGKYSLPTNFNEKQKDEDEFYLPLSV